MGKNKTSNNLQTLLSSEDLFDIPSESWDISRMSKSTKKKVNGKRKGSNYERVTANYLSKRFNDTFRRVPQSGAIMGGVNRKYNEGLRQDAQEILCGDIIAPVWFPFVIECKNYADTPKLPNLLSKGDKDLDKWLSQALKETEVAHKPWLILFKVTSLRGKEFVCIDQNLFHQKLSSANGNLPHSYIIYNGSIIIDNHIFFDEYFHMFTDYDYSKKPTDRIVKESSLENVSIENILDDV